MVLRTERGPLKRRVSGDTAPHAPEREVEDLLALIEAVGGDAAVLGHSAGAALSVVAARAGVPMTHLFVSKPPLRFGEDEPPADLAERLCAARLRDWPRPHAAPIRCEAPCRWFRIWEMAAGHRPNRSRWPFCRWRP